MDTKLKSTLLYAIADVLGMTVNYDHETKKLVGETSRDVHFGSLPVSVDIKIASSLILPDEYMLVCRVMGNFGLFVAASAKGKGDRIELHFLNASKLDSFTGWLEKKQPKDAKHALQLFGPAVVKSFVKSSRNVWKQAA